MVTRGAFSSARARSKVEEFLLGDVFECVGIQNSASSHSNVVFCSQGEGAPDNLSSYDLASACLYCVVVREHPRLSWVDTLPMGVKYI